MQAAVELVFWILVTLSADVWTQQEGNERRGDGILVSIVFKF